MIYGWLGLILIFAGASTAVTVTTPSYSYLPVALFISGVITLLINSYQLIELYGRRQDKTDIEFQAKAVSDILQVAATRDNLIDLLNYSLDRFLELYSLNSGAIHIFHKQRNTLIMGSYRGLTPICASKLEKLEPGQTAIGRTIQNKRVLIIRDLSVSPDYQFFGSRIEGYSFLAVAPIIVDNDCWGVITLLGRKKYHRGMLDINLLEQFGYKLGQALVLGRENRRVASTNKTLSNLVSFYNTLFSNLNENLLMPRKSIFGVLKYYPEKFLGRLPFCILTVSSGQYQIVYRYGLDIKSDKDSFIIQNECKIDFSKLDYKDEKLFKINNSEISEMLQKIGFKNKKAVTCAFTFSENWKAVIVIDIAKISEVQGFANDIQLLKQLISFEYVKNLIALYSSKLKAHKQSKGSINIVSKNEHISSLLNTIAQNIQTSIAKLSSNDKDIDINEYKQSLIDIENSIFSGMNILTNTSFSAKPDNIIKSILLKENLTVDFSPGIELSEIKSDRNDFKNIIEEILKASIHDGKKIQLKTSSFKDTITLTINGSVKSGFPSSELAKNARLNNIEIEMPRNTTTKSEEKESSNNANQGQAQNTVLAIENNKSLTNILKDFFSGTDYKFSAVTTGADSLSYLETARLSEEIIDIAIIEMSLDDITGLELSHQIKRYDNSIFTILIVSRDMNLNKSTLNDARVDAVVNKPFRLEQFNLILEEKKRNNATSI